ncbi:MAG: tRNA pseudouridine(13) synthase TruD [Pseudomonadota bacterium]
MSARGRLRVSADDFHVTEVLGFEPQDDGPHALVRIEKRGRNTLDMIASVARHAGVRPRDVGYAGLKDRHAVTQQWITLPLDPARASACLAPDSGADGWRVVSLHRNQRKLKLGAHKQNRFRIVVRELDGDVTALRERLERVASEGVPNYFGSQRFGRDGDNLRRARRWFLDGVDLARRQRRFALSAARSWAFNRVLAARITAGTWDSLLPGEPVCLDGSRSLFIPEPDDPDVFQRLDEQDVHPSGPLVGRGELPVTGECARFEAAALDDLAWLIDGVSSQGVKHERRALRLAVREFDYDLSSDALVLSFALARGCFATAVVRELLDVVGERLPG